METWRARIGADGQVAVPTAALAAAGLEAGEEVVVRAEDGEVRIASLQRAVGRAQAIVRQYVPAGASLVDELIAERRDEAKRQ